MKSNANMYTIYFEAKITDGIHFVLQRENSIKLGRTELKHEGLKGIKNG